MKNKLLSIMLSVMVAVTMMPASTLTTFAADGKGETDDSSGGLIAGAKEIVESVTDTVGDAVNKIGSILTPPEDGSDDIEILDDTETELDALGFDTTELPEDYDPDEDSNPMGTEYSTMQEYGEILTYNENGGSSVSKLYGHKNALNDDYTPFKSEKGTDKSGISTDKNASVLATAGDFKGTGRRSCMAYLTYKWDGEVTTKRIIELKIYDPEEDRSSGTIAVDKLEGFPFEPILSGRFGRSLIDIDTGDYDGDGLDEIAVIVPQSSCSHMYLAIYKNTDENGVLDNSKWKRVWTHTLDNEVAPLLEYNCVDVVSGDVSGDGIDDMILSWGDTVYDDNGKLNAANSVKSRSQILYGGKTGDMLKKYQDIDFDEDLCRVAFAIGDLNNDSINDVVMGGERIEDAVNGNTSRYLGYYEYDEESGKLSPSCLQNINVVDKKDEVYLSSPLMKANIAFCEMYGKAESNCIYLDSVLYKFDDEFEIVDKLYAPKTDDKPAGPFSDSPSYLEFNATGAYLAGPATQGLIVERAHINSDCHVTDYYMDLIHADPSDLHSGSTLQKEELNSYTSTSESGMIDIPYQNFATVLDTDNDSAVMRYTGNQTFTYSEPKVYAILASAPYFEDVAENAEDGGDIKAFSSTSWGKSHGDSQGDGVEFHIQAGFVMDNSIQTLTYSASNHLEGGAYYSNSVDWVRGKDYTMTYSTSAGEDCVVFYSIPTAVYEYEVEYLTEDDDGNVEQKKKMEYIAIPYTPVSQTITMETYNEIQKQNPSLPVLDGTAITSKCGDPGSYPSSSKGFNDAEVFDGDWSAPSYSNGGTVTQEITDYNEKTISHAVGIYLGMSATAGSAGTEMGVGMSGNIGYIFSFTDKEGTTASGTVYNMVPDAKGYGYYFSWKLMTYTYKSPDGTEIPVVTYLTKDVTEPPALPNDFRQDHANTTDSQVGLQWTYKGKNVTQFDIYRHTEFPDGANDVLIGTVNQGDFKYKKNKYGNLVYDENGEPIKQYSFIDTGLAEYSDYSYRLQVKRQNVPPWSIPTKELKCKTRALYHPEVQLSEEELTVYYDSINTVTADVKKSDSFIIRNKTFQWQKYNELTADWEDIPLAQSNSYKFSKNQRQNAGDYRCRINSEISVLGAVYRISAYSETLTVKFAKRNVKFGEISCMEGNDSVRFTLPITNCGDGARTQPQGYIDFALDDGQELNMQRVKIDSETQTATVVCKDLKDGTYELSSSYVGNSKTFKDANNPDTFLYMKNVKQAEWLSMKRTNKYNENLMDTLKLYELYYNGEYSASRKDITDTITEIRIVDDKDIADTTDDVEYAAYNSESIAAGEARIPARLENTFNRKELVVKVYDEAGKELASDVRHKLRIQKGSAILGFDDIEATEKSSETITGADLLIWNADGYEDGDKAIRTDKITTGNEAFTSAEAFNIAVYTPTGSLLKTEASIDTTNLMPGEYKIKPVANKTSGNLHEDDLFDIEYKEFTLTVYGNTYTIKASGQTINSKTVGCVSLTSPDQIDDVAKLQEGVEYQGGTTLTFKAHPIMGYSLSYWLVNGKKVETPTDILTYAVKGTPTDIDVKAVFALNENRLKVRTLGVGTDSDCTVNCISGDLGGDPVHDEQGTIVMTGKELTFKALAATGYDFVEWRYVAANGKTTVNKGTGEGKENTAAFVMGDTSATLYAVFQKSRADVELSDHLKAYYLNKTEFNASIEEDVEVEVGKDMKVPVGATMIIRPQGGYIRTGEWDVNVTDTSGDSSSVEITAVEGSKAIKFTLPEDAAKVSVEADCTLGIYDVLRISESNKVNVDLSINGKKIEKPGTDNEDEVYSADGGAEFELTATPKRGYKFSYWKINGQKIDNPSRTYAGIVKENMVIDAVCEEVDSHSVQVAVEGQDGTIYYVIETPYGVKTTSSPLSSDKKIEPVYEGESITFNSVPAAGYVAAYYIVDGEKHECTDNSFTVSNVSKDTNITIGYYPAVYHRLTVTNNSKYSVTTSEGRNVEDVLHLGYQEQCKLIISGVTDATNHLDVRLNGEKLNPTSEGDNKYSVTVGPLDADAELRIEDKNTYLIKDVEDLKAFLDKTQNSDEKINGKLTKDIEITTVEDIHYLFKNTIDDNKTRCLRGILDGQGFKIYTNLTDSVSVDGYMWGIFYKIEADGVLKNITIQGFNLTDSNRTGSCYSALLTYSNAGTIDSCTVSDCSIQFNSFTDLNCAWVSYINKGMVHNCMVRNINIDHHEAVITKSCSSVVYKLEDSGIVQSCYVINSTRKNNCLATKIIVHNNNGKNDVENCWYDQGNIDDATDPDCSGNNVWKSGTKRSAAEIAYLLNDNGKEKVWGTWEGTDAYPVPIDSGMKEDEKTPKVPFKITYKNDEQRVVEYSVSNEITLGNTEVSDVKAWKTTDVCYANKSKVSINGDTTFEAVAEPEKEYGCMLEPDAEQTKLKYKQYFEDLNEAIAEANKIAEKKGGEVSVYITADKNISESINIGNNVFVDIGQVYGEYERYYNSIVTIDEGCAVENNGKIVITQGASLENYGSFQNNFNANGFLSVYPGGSIRNAGTYLNKGKITPADFKPICITHSWGAPKVTQEPTVTEEGVRTITCEVCGKPKTEKIDRTPENVKLDFLDGDEIVVNKNQGYTVTAVSTPENCIGNITWSSQDKSVATVEPIGDEENHNFKAVVTGISDGETSITAMYSNEYGYTVSKAMKCSVSTVIPVTKISFTSNEYTMFAGATKKLTPEIEPDNYNVPLKWSSDNKSIVTVDKDGVLTGEAKGEATITVKAGSVSASVEVTVIEESDLVSDIERLKADIGKAQNAIKKNTDDINSMKGEIETLGNDIINAQERITNLEGEHSSVLEALNELRNQYNQTVEEYNKTKAKVTDLETKISDVAEEAKSATEEVRTELLGKLGILNNELDAAEEQINTIQSTIAVMQEEITEFNVEMELNCDEVVTLDIDDSIAVIAKLTPEECIGNVEWTSDDEDVATVDKAGDKGTKAVVTGKNNGIAKITAKYSNQYGHSIARTFTCKVGDVAPLEAVLFSSDKCTLLVGTSTILVARVIPDTSKVKYTWTSNDNDVVTVDQKGQLTGVAKGDATITLKVDDGNAALTATVDVTVIEEDVDPIDVGALKEQLAGAKTAIEKFSSDMTKIAETLEQLKEAVEKTPGEPADLTMQYGKIEDSYGAIGAIITELEGKLESITASVDKEENPQQMKIELDNLCEAVTDTQSKIEAINADISKLQKDVKERNRKEISVKLNSTSFTYTGKTITPTVTVTDSDGKTLKKGTDYDASVTSGKNVGTYTVKVTGKDNYKGTKSVAYVINPKGATIKTPKKAKNAFTAKWKKQSGKMSKSRITGYQVRYATNSSFSGYKYKTIKGYSKTSKKITKLKKKTKYYVQVRTYMKVSGKTYYSSWSKAKSVKTK